MEQGGQPDQGTCVGDQVLFQFVVYARGGQQNADRLKGLDDKELLLALANAVILSLEQRTCDSVCVSSARFSRTTLDLPEFIYNNALVRIQSLRGDPR